MRVAVLTCDRPDQAALCHRVAAHAEVVSLVVSENRPPRARRFAAWKIRQRIAVRTAGRPFLSAWRALQDRYRAQTPGFPEVPLVRVHEINEPETLEALARANPDLVLVSGTNLIGQAIFDWAAQHSAQRAAWRGMLNLHTGLAPYMRGGPNCTNWCLAERAFHLIGNTVHWLDAGIDAGPLAATAQTPLTGHETLDELHWAVMEHAQQLAINSVQRLAAGRPLPRVPQRTVADGRVFLTREWNGPAMRAAWANFRRDYTPAYFAGAEYRERSAELKLVSLEEEFVLGSSGCVVTQPLKS